MSYGVLPIQGTDPVAAAKKVAPASEKKVRRAFVMGPDGSISLGTRSD